MLRAIPILLLLVPLSGPRAQEEPKEMEEPIERRILSQGGG